MYAIRAAPDSSIYAGGERGISRFHNGTWKHVFPPEGFPIWPVSSLSAAADGAIWAATPWGALRIANEQPILFTSSDVAAALKELTPGLAVSVVSDAAVPQQRWVQGSGTKRSFGRIGARLVMGRTLDAPVRIIPKTIWALAPGGPAAKAGLRIGDRVVTVKRRPPLEDERPKDQSIEITAKRPGRSDLIRKVIEPQRLSGGVRDFGVSDIFEDRDGAMWFSLEDGPVVRCRLQADEAARCRLYTERDGLDLGAHPKIAQTADGAIWVVSDSGKAGVNRFDGRTWMTFRFSKLGGTDANSSVLTPRDGSLWIAGGQWDRGSLAVLREGSWHIYDQSDIPIALYRAGLLESSDGSIWIFGQERELARLDYSDTRWHGWEGLAYQCDTPDGRQWFLSEDGEAHREACAEPRERTQPQPMHGLSRGQAAAAPMDEVTAVKAESRVFGKPIPHLAEEV